MSRRSQHYPGFRTILLSFNLSTLGIIIAVVIALFAFLYTIIDDMQNRIQQYILLNQLSTELNTSEYEFTLFFTEYRERSTSAPDAKEPLSKADKNYLIEIWNTSMNLRTQALYTTSRLESDYEKNPEKYFLNRGIRHGIEFVNNTCQEFLNEDFSLNTESYKKYYQVLKVYSYIKNFTGNLYLAAAVKSDVSALIMNIHNSEVLKKEAIIIISIIVCLSIVAVLTITKKLSRNISEMLSEAEKITEGNFDTPDLKLKGPRELIQLRNRINIMKSSLSSRRELENKIHFQELEHEKITRELETARYRSLQAQINPHFLFNTLNIISHTALFEKANQTVKLINSLASLFRYNLDFKNETNLKNELSFVEKYLDIQKARFRERLSFSITCPEELEETVIPHFSIQPLVENAVVHGIEPMEKGGKIEINVEKSENNIIISIMDDGKGIPAGFTLTDNSNEKKHIGIENVMNRIKMFNPYSTIEFSRLSETGGTLVKIFLPQMSQMPQTLQLTKKAQISQTENMTEKEA